LPQGNDLNDVAIIDENTMVAVGVSGLILKTTDSGINWLIKESGIADDLDELQFIDNYTGWVIGGGKLYKLSEIAIAIKEVVDNADIELGPGYSEVLLKQTVIRGPGDITRAKNELGYRPKYSLKKGIKEYANWLKKQKY